MEAANTANVVAAAQTAVVEVPASNETQPQAINTRIFPLANYTKAVLIVSVSGFNFGFDTGSIGPITVMPQFEADFGRLSPALHGLLVSSILITASLSSLFSGPIADRISRTYTIALGGAVFAIGSILSCASTTLPMAFVGRCIAGVGEGLFLATGTVYSCEISPYAMRGRLAGTAQFFTSLGLVIGYFTCYGSSRIDSSAAWRIPFAVQTVVAIFIALRVRLLPHSPRWLRHQNRRAEAESTWIRLGVSAAEAEKEEETGERQERAKVPLHRKLTALWEKNVRGRTLLTCFINAMNQATGIDAVLYYAPTLFLQAGLNSQTAAFLASGASALLILTCTTVAQIYADTWGRRRSTVYGGVGIALSMLAIGVIYASNAHQSKGGRYAVIGLIYAFIAVFSLLWSVQNRIYCSEIHPMRTRAAATSLGQCVNWVVNWLIAFSTPLFLAKTSSGPYFLFGGCAVATVLVCLAFQVESKGHTLEEIDVLFKDSPWRKALRKFQAQRVERSVHIRLQSYTSTL